MSGIAKAGFSFLKNLVKGGSKTSPTISSTTINVGNLKKNKETIGKFIKTTDSYVKAAKEKGFEKLSKDLRRAGSKSLQKTDKILRKNKKYGGRMGLKKGGGSDLGMQSVKHGIDNNPNITAADPKAKFIAAAKNKKKKFESPMARAIKKKNKKRFV